MFRIFRKKKVSETVTGKMTPIKRFDSREEYLNMLNELISDIEIDSNNWVKSSFTTTYGGSLTFSKGKGSSLSSIGNKNSVEIRVEFGFSSEDEFKCDKIELKIGNHNCLTIENCNDKISKQSLRILYDFYCREQISENNKLSSRFNKDKSVVDELISKSTKRDDKLKKLGL